MSEKRFAILIGINDYNTSPLSFCVNDGEALKSTLIEYANFSESNIYTIFSSQNSSIKDITGALLNAIDGIRQTFNEGSDSIFFFFAGHGAVKEGRSHLLFHDSLQSIVGIFDKIEALKPKMQFYVIDACESGGKTLTRSRGAIDEKILDEFISASSGAMFLYACQSTESAFEIESVQHGIMTHYFIESIKQHELYDDGILTPGRIQEYVSKNVARYSNFEQNPVMESRITGYYPFASIKKEIQVTSDSREFSVPEARNSELIGDSHIIAYDKDTRIRIQKIAINRLHHILTGLAKKYESTHTIQYAPTINDYPFRSKVNLINKIVHEASGKLESIKNTISVKKIPVYSSSMSATVLAALGERTIKEYRDEPQIASEHEYLDASGYIATSNSIDVASLGFGGIAYQAKWGLVITAFYFQIDWDGEQDSIIRSIEKKDYTFLITPDSFDKMSNISFDVFSGLEDDMKSWNEMRKAELEKFGS